MGNSLLDIIVFGRRAGQTAAAMVKSTKEGKPTLAHLKRFEAERAKAGIQSDTTSPLLFPDYVRRAENATV
jgi:succinate dehydrogenase / fumarate reductase flavoprotein subunit